MKQRVGEKIMKKFMYPHKIPFTVPLSNNDNRQIKETYVPFKHEFEENFLKLFGIIL